MKKISIYWLSTIICIAFFSGIFFYSSYSKPIDNKPSQTNNNIKSEDAIVRSQAEPTFEVDSTSIYVARNLKVYQGIQAGFVYKDNLEELNQKIPFKLNSTTEKITSSEIKNFDYPYNLPRLKDLYRGQNYPQKNLLVFPKFKIEAPLIHSSLDDFFETYPSGEINFSKFIEESKESINKKDFQSVNIQKLLSKGVVRLAFTPLPGEIGNSYIVGHSSNFSSVKSDYNFIFKDLVNQSPIDQVFSIYDHQGRKLDFKVFEAIQTSAEDTTTAYKNYPNERVVTLQSSPF